MSACVCIRVRVTRVQVRLLIQMYHTYIHSIPVIPCFTTRWSHCLVLLTDSDEQSDKVFVCINDVFLFFFNSNYFVINSNHVIWLIMNLHSLTAHMFTFDICESRPEFLTPLA